MSDNSPKPNSIDADNAKLQLALRPADAAKALGIGERMLWSLTNRGEIPHVKLGRRTLYPIDALRAWLEERTRSSAAGEPR